MGKKRPAIGIVVVVVVLVVGGAACGMMTCANNAVVQDLRTALRVGMSDAEVRDVLSSDERLDSWGHYEDEHSYRAIVRDVGGPFKEQHIVVLVNMDENKRVRDVEVKLLTMGP